MIPVLRIVQALTLGGLLLVSRLAFAQANADDQAVLDAVQRMLVEPISWQLAAGAAGAVLLWVVGSWKKIATVDTKKEVIGLLTFIGGASVPLLLAGASWQVVLVGGIGSFMLFVNRNAASEEERAAEASPKKTTTAAILLVGLLVLPGCAGVMRALQTAEQAAQWLGSVVDVAEAGSQAYFARHPNQQRQDDVAFAIDRTRKSLLALNAALATAEAVDDGDVQTARLAALEAYAALYDMLDNYGLRTARPPAGGAETDAPPPEPIDIPAPEHLTTL